MISPWWHPPTSRVRAPNPFAKLRDLEWHRTFKRVKQHQHVLPDALFLLKIRRLMARPRVEPSSHCSDCCGPPPALNQRISSPSRQFSRRSSGCVARRAINRRVKSRSFSSFSVSPSQFTRRSRCPDNSRYYCPFASGQTHRLPAASACRARRRAW